MTRIPLILLTAMLATGAAAQHDDAPVGAKQQIGTVAFGAACVDEAQQAFDRALGLMHHMMYVQARGEFAAIAEAHPDCAMAHWGVATTLFQPLWATTPSDAEIARGRDAIEQARATVNEEREQALIEATAAFFEPDTDRQWDRLSGWTDGMAAAYQAYPNDHDIAALYALSLLTEATRADDRDALHDEAEAILKRVWDEESTHPGAIHYAIHATDADGRAENALEMVESYGKIAPNVPHALHMPSHIYVRLGDWPQVIDWNARSAEVAREHKVNGAISFHYIHAIDYLVYGHLQRGEDSTAENIHQAAFDEGRHQGSFPGAFHLAAMPARLAVEQRDWDAAAAIEPRVPDYIAWENFHWAEGLSWYGRGLGAVHTGDLEAAREAEQRLASLADGAASAPDDRFQVYIEADRHILAGFIAHAEGDHERAVELMRTAGELESSVEKHPVSPGALLPPYEALGEVLLALDRPDEALAAFKRSDQMWPGRYNTLLGAIRAADAAGDAAAATSWAARLLEVAPNAERDTIDRARTLAQRH
ncbi:TPR repeat protein [Thioalkalivibrio nitratireducens DSM 14787]|uniref:TPR repeat protein n=1 Tax=Thioalkalivibrio nitratireducens (strain DSM 14787 / UNIQEM 213 / ALEN2) TaxID=1255043 RepID=L0E0G4_THIND|nr:TPR repeat protein [Thioalkalivibrio nitratireducens]AGA34705.1 TPR repeat protein [Thioalkalivibrio nitratireducens DSM 14787]